MCGIAGIVHFDGQSVEADRLQRACTAQRHRGPNDTGVWIEPQPGGSVGLAAVRLAVLDPSRRCGQPFHDATGRYHLVYNGELYNYRELRRKLHETGWAFRTQGDTEVLLAALVHWGVEALGRLNGMWAFAFYDAQERRGLLARDRFGKKPLMYASNRRRLLFASEMAGLRALERLGGGVDASALVQLLRYGYVAAPRTILADVLQLEPGHLLAFTATTDAPPMRYYRPAAQAPQGGQRDGTRVRESYGDACRRLRRTVEAAVVARRIADVPIGSFLSGGVDSAIVTHHLRDALGGEVNTFSVGYADHTTYDESRYAQRVAEHLGTVHHPLVLTTKDLVSGMSAILDHVSQPVGDSSIVPTALLARHARKLVTVALSGDGGDELFGGYWRYQGHRTWETYRRIPWMVRKGLVEPWMNRMRPTSVLAQRVRQFRKLVRVESDDTLTRHLAWSRILSPEGEAIFRDAEVGLAVDREVRAEAEELTAEFSDEPALARILAFDVQYGLPGDMLHKVDTASMAYSLEVRIPFLDRRVVETALELPVGWKIDRGIGKRVLVDAYRSILPDEILDRPKQGFEAPMAELFRGAAGRMFRDVVTRRTVESLGLLSYAGVEEVFRQHVEQRADHADLLFALLSLCRWRERQPL